MYGVRERVALWKCLYMDVVASVRSSTVACAAEREEVRECLELLEKSFGVGQQCGCTNANAKRRTTKERQRKRHNKEQKGWKGDKKLRGEG